MPKLSWIICLTSLSPLQAGTSLAQELLPDAVRAATEKYQDVAAAEADGYSAMPCVSGPASGAMGVHYVNTDNLGDDAIDVARPEALMYEPQADGSLELLGAEFITFTGPAVLDGHLFHFVGAPNRYGLDPFYELHVWAWRDNPNGMFSDFNPDVSCEAMKGGAPMSH